MSNVICKYTASMSQGANTGTLTLQDCQPSISNDETMGYGEVIGVVVAIVILGLVIQWIMHRVNHNALAHLKADLKQAAADAKGLAQHN
jgi:large-conductance mechanosensitive channel